MADQIQFETPENIEVSYTPAGTGTRFVSWVLDSILVGAVCIALLFIMMCSGMMADSVFQEILGGGNPRNPEDMLRIQFVVWGIWTLLWGLGSFFYFGLSELFLRGQTVGKRQTKIRVVKADGFSLDAISILVRNIFRIVDQLPPLWVVPVLSKRSQRLGDMVAGTIVVADRPEQLGFIRMELGQRPITEAQFRFDATMLKQLRREDIRAIEKILERWMSLTSIQQRDLSDRIVPALCQRMKIDEPAGNEQIRFLEDLLAAEYRRESRILG